MLLLFWKEDSQEFPRKPGTVYYDSFTGGRARDYRGSQQSSGVRYTPGDGGGATREYIAEEDK